MVPTLHHGIFASGHVVAEIVESKFSIGSVGDVAGIGLTLCLGINNVWSNPTDGQSEEPVKPPHPLTVSCCKVVIHRDEVDTFAR